MKKLSKSVQCLVGALAVGAMGTALAHVNVAPEGALTVGENSREYIEGSRAYIQLNLPEDCSNESGSERFAIASAVIVLPNGEGLSEDFYSTGHGSTDPFSANIMMGTKPRADASWNQVGAELGAVSDYGKRSKTADSRALKWLGGHVKTTYAFQNAEFVTSLPKINADSCVVKARVEIPTVTYCTGGYSRAWIGTAGSNFVASEKQVVEETYEPYFYVVRADSNPLPEACGDGETITVRPTDDDINQYSGDWLNNEQGLYGE